MGVETVFLIVLIIALIIGNALISFLSGEKMQEKAKKETDDFPIVHEPAPKSAELMMISSHLRGLQEKLSVMNKKLASLEEKIENGGIDPQTKERIRKFDHFRASAQADIQGLKEIVLEMKERASSKPKKGHKDDEKDISDNEMHGIIYRSNK